MTTSHTETATSSKPEAPASAPAEPKPLPERPYSPGLTGVIAAETAIGFVDGEKGQLLYRGYPIGQLVEKGTYGRVAELLWTGGWSRPRSRSRSFACCESCHPIPIPWMRFGPQFRCGAPGAARTGRRR